ncbi:RNA polymerase sigma factor [Leisingera caerulea]|uniref:RNA polymerase sigma factor n=1 Tax=Leisingera caerulea TaxID=506591 RepID=UPI0004877AF7|nr:RNA polymerase sigma factor [Leisingera caerulea]
MTLRHHRYTKEAIGSVTPEAELVLAARHGSEHAIRELIRRLNPRLFRVARGIVSSDAEAEEIVQETYLAAFSKIESFRGQSRFSTWVTRIALNAARTHCRRDRSAEEYDTVSETNTPQVLELFPNQSELPEAALGRAQLRGLLENSVACLPSELRLPFLLREVEGMTISEISDELELNKVTVKTRLFRARRRLRSALENSVSGGFDAIFPFDGQRCARMADRVILSLRENKFI